MKTLLFDIDGTLIRTGGAGLHAMQIVMSDMFGIAQLAKVEVRGRTDRSILRDLFTAHQIEDSASSWSEFCQAYLKQLPNSLAEKPGRLLPGVESALQSFAAAEDVAVGLLTGNMRSAAIIKLTHFDVAHNFAFGGFGDHNYCRNDVARDAQRAARDHLDGSFDERQVFVIGDTPLDVECGRAIGAHTIGVLTGGFDRAQMSAAAPDLLLDDLSDIPQAIADWK
jgi:phosphoglycolate phosphatase-like HAD superfamily hydrolase